MNNPMWKRSLPAFALLAFLGADQQAAAADKPPSATPAVSRSEAKQVTTSKARGAAIVRRKLELITLDMQADSLPLGEIVNLLIDETRKRDPEKEGINILLYNSGLPGVPAIDPATGLPIGETKMNLKAAIAGETHEYSDMYPGMAKQAREEGFSEIADWFETLAKAERSHANRFQKALDSI